MIPLGGAPCIVCHYPNGVLVLGERVQHDEWRCRLPAGPIQVPYQPVARAAASSRRVKSVSRREQRRRFWYAARVEIDGRLVAPVRPELHGRYDTYVSYGCRCEQCVSGMKERRHKRYALRVLVDGVLVAPLPERRHGKRATYNEHGCRCGLCSAAAAQRGSKQAAA